ncbi:MAG: alpha-1,2-fucosyltransferase [Cyanobacteria bacterium J06635_15]
MSNPDDLTKLTAKSKYTPKSETERTFSILDDFRKEAENTKSLLVNEDISVHQPVLTMSSIGQLGRFGNQLFQYAFLRICAEKSGATVECPPWVGQTLFGHSDASISKRLPPAVECNDEREILFDIIPEFIPFLEKLANAKSTRVSSEVLETGLSNVDLWGFFQFNTRCLQSHRQYFRSLFQPVSDLKSALEQGLNRLRSKGKMIVGIHIRRGDYMTEPRLGFTLAFPTKWYCEWLDQTWDELEDPILFLCSDDLDSIVHDFDKFSPVTSKDLAIQLPERLKNLAIEFYIDFFMLSNCDVVVTSNSNFSFVACLLNQRAKLFVRPYWDFSSKFEVFDPWDSDPLLWLENKQPNFFKSLPDTLSVTYTTQGLWAMLKSLFIYFPQSCIKEWAIRAYLGYQINGIYGVIKSLLYTFGCRNVWKGDW